MNYFMLLAPFSFVCCTINYYVFVTSVLFSTFHAERAYICTDGLTGCPEDHVQTDPVCAWNCQDELAEYVTAIMSWNVKSVHVCISPSELGPT